MRAGVTVGGVPYMAFDDLPGVRESASFRFCARQIVASYVELLVLQDELRREWGRNGLDDFGAKSNQAARSSLDALNIVNQGALWREFITVSAVAAKIVKHFSHVEGAYGRMPKPQGCWRESLEGGFVALALRIKSQVTGVAKISKEGAVFLGNDVPVSRSTEDVARFAVKCVNHHRPAGTPEEQEALAQMEVARALALETVEAVTAALLRKSLKVEGLAEKSSLTAGHQLNDSPHSPRLAARLSS